MQTQIRYCADIICDYDCPRDFGHCMVICEANHIKKEQPYFATLTIEEQNNSEHNSRTVDITTPTFNQTAFNNFLRYATICPQKRER